MLAEKIVWMAMALALLIFCAAISVAEDRPDYPHVTLSNGMIKAVVLLPDVKDGYYRGRRFDWSGLVWQLTYRNHTFFGEVMKPDKEDFNFGISLAEEFGSGMGMENPVGYDEAKQGEPFLKIGVGVLEKTGDGPYGFWVPYRILEPGTWTVKKGSSWVEFVQEIKEVNGYGYRYNKRLELRRHQPELVMSHSLTNTGAKTITTNQYCHNFFVIDHEPPGTNYQLEFGFVAKAKGDLKGISVKNRTLTFTEDFHPEHPALFTGLEGFTGKAAENCFVLRNLKTGAQVEVRGDFQLSAFNFFANSTAVCPEPFIAFELEPSETKSWKRVYKFQIE